MKVGGSIAMGLAEGDATVTESGSVTVLSLVMTLDH